MTEPTLTDELREHARSMPGGWLYAIDPDVDADGEVPPFAIAGAWAVDENGEPGAFEANPDHVPGPYQTEVRPDAVVYLPAREDGELIAYEGPDGPYVKALSEPEYAAGTEPMLVPVPLADLLDRLPPGTTVRIDPGTDEEIQLLPDAPAADVPAFPRKGAAAAE
jgi:hypothetical protein